MHAAKGEHGLDSHRASLRGRFVTVLRGILLGAIVAALVAWGLFVLIVICDPRHSSTIENLANGAVLACAAGAGIGAFSSLIWTHKRSTTTRSRQSSGPDFSRGTTAGANDFSARMARYLEDTGKPERLSDVAEPSSMEFFAMVSTDRRHAPKSPTIIRQILLRIHRLLHGHSELNGNANRP
jgi:hypothetical protein